MGGTTPAYLLDYKINAPPNRNHHGGMVVEHSVNRGHVNFGVWTCDSVRILV